MYIGFLLSEPSLVSCCRLGNVLNISHDSVNRFLNRESYSPQGLYHEVSPTLNLIDGILSVDDSVLDKPYPNYIAYVDYFLEILAEVLSWGMKPFFVTGDSWYSWVKSLKTIKNNQCGFLF
jgi:hypothetical protein